MRARDEMKYGDAAFAAFYVFAIFGNLSVDVWMGFDVDLSTTGLAFHQTVFDMGKQYV